MLSLLSDDLDACKEPDDIGVNDHNKKAFSKGYKNEKNSYGTKVLHRLKPKYKMQNLQRD